MQMVTILIAWISTFQPLVAGDASRSTAPIPAIASFSCVEPAFGDGDLACFLRVDEFGIEGRSRAEFPLVSTLEESGEETDGPGGLGVLLYSLLPSKSRLSLLGLHSPCDLFGFTPHLNRSTFLRC